MVKGAQWRPLSVVAVPLLQEENGGEQEKEEQKKGDKKEEKKREEKKPGDMSETETSRQTIRRVSFTKQDIKAAIDIQRYGRGHAGRARAKFKSETKQQVLVIEKRRRDQQEQEQEQQAQEEKEEEEDGDKATMLNNKKIRRRRQQPPRKKYQYTESPVNDVFHALSQRSNKLRASDLLRSMTSPRLIEFVRPLTRLMDSLLPTMTTTASTTQDNDTSSRREVVRSSKILRSLLVPGKYQQMFQSMVQHATSTRSMEGGEKIKSYLTLTDFEQMCWYGLPMEMEKKNEEKKEIEKEDDEKEKNISESDKETSMRQQHFMEKTDCRTTRIMVALFKNILLPVNGRSYDLKKILLPVTRKTSANVSSQSPSKEELFTPASPASPASPTLPTLPTLPTSPTLPTLPTLPASLMVPDTSTLTTLVVAEEKSSQSRHTVDTTNIELKKNAKIKKMKRNENTKRRKKKRIQGISLESRKSAPFPEWLALEPTVTPLPPRQPLSPSTKRHLLIKMPSPSSSSALLDTLEQEEEIMDQQQQMWVTVDERGEMFVNDTEESEIEQGATQDVVAASEQRYFQPPDLSRKQRRRKKNKGVTKKKKFKKNSKKMQAGGGQAMPPPQHHDSRNAGFFFEGSTDRNPLLTTHARQQQQQKTSPRVKSKESTTLRNLMTGSNLSLYQADFMLSVLR